jgi:hypothetical protein
LAWEAAIEIVTATAPSNFSPIVIGKKDDMPHLNEG